MHQPPTSLLHGKPQNPKQMPETGTKGKGRKGKYFEILK
jgi:hypothetical protein